MKLTAGFARSKVFCVQNVHSELVGITGPEM